MAINASGRPVTPSYADLNIPRFEPRAKNQTRDRLVRSSGRNGKEDCEVKNLTMSGNSASYTMVCNGGEMTADNNITFVSDGYTMDMKMVMNQAGRTMNIAQHIERRYLGPCSK